MFIDLSGDPSNILSKHLNRLGSTFREEGVPKMGAESMPLGKLGKGLPMSLDNDMKKLKPASLKPLPMNLDDDMKALQKSSSLPNTNTPDLDKDLADFPNRDTGRKVPEYHEARSDQIYGGAPKFEDIRQVKSLIETEPVVSELEDDVGQLRPKAGSGESTRDYHKRILEYVRTQQDKRANVAKGQEETKESEKTEAKKKALEGLKKRARQRRVLKEPKTIIQGDYTDEADELFDMLEKAETNKTPVKKKPASKAPRNQKAKEAAQIPLPDSPRDSPPRRQTRSRSLISADALQSQATKLKKKSEEKKPEAKPEAPEAPRRGISADALRSQATKLKKAEAKPAPAKKTPAKKGELADALAVAVGKRRSAMQTSSDEEDSGWSEVEEAYERGGAAAPRFNREKVIADLLKGEYKDKSGKDYNLERLNKLTTRRLQQLEKEFLKR